MWWLLYIWIGWILRDWYVSYCIRYAAIGILGDEHGLSGDTLNHIRCMGIHDPVEIESIIDRLPIDYTTDGTIIPPLLRTMLYKWLSSFK